MGPTASLTHREFESEVIRQGALAAVAIYAEATLESFVQFVDALRFYHLWRMRQKPRRYTRRMRGVRLPNFIVSLRETDTGTQVIDYWKYVLVVSIVLVVACVICIPVIIFDLRGAHTDAEMGINATGLFLLITTGTGGNTLAGLIFTVERFDIEGLLSIQGLHVQILVPALYSLWIIFATSALVCRVWVYSSPNPSLRALANVYLFRVSADHVVTTVEEHSGHIDAGKLYINLNESWGTARISVGPNRTPKEVCLDDIVKLS